MSGETERHLFNVKKTRERDRDRETVVWGFNNWARTGETHPQLNSSVVLHDHLQVDWGLGPGPLGEADVEGVLAQLVGGVALVVGVVGVEGRLDGEGGLPGAVPNLVDRVV